MHFFHIIDGKNLGTIGLPRHPYAHLLQIFFLSTLTITPDW